VDRGAVSVQLVIAAPLMLLLLMLIVQFAVYLHASHVAQASAAQALAAARVEGGSAADGNAQAEAVLNDLAQGVLLQPEVTVVRGAARVRVEITGVAQMVVPPLRLPVHVVAEGPAEEWTTQP
jgi:Flp pilus assembly protein TadG